MKKLLATAVILTFTLAAYSQSMRIAYIDSDSALKAVSGYEQNIASVESFSEEVQNEVEALGKQFESKLAEYQNAYGRLSEQERQTNEQALAKMEESIRTKQENGQKQLQEKQQELMEPLYKRLDEAISAVAENGEYDFVVGQDVFLYAKIEHDITAQVIALLKK